MSPETAPAGPLACARTAERVRGAPVTPAPAGSRLRGAAWLLVPAAAAFLVYANTLDARFVYDDQAQIVRNPWVQELRYFPKIVSEPVWAYRTSQPTNYYRPFQMGLYNLMWAAADGQPWLFHAVNVLLHVLNTIALALLVRRLSRDGALAFGAALLFAVHPLTTEAVAWIACLPELGYGLFVLLALNLHVAAWEAAPARRRVLLAAAAAAFGAGLLSKETAVTMVGLVGLLELWLRPGPRGLLARGLAAVRACVPYLVVTAGYAALRLAIIGGVAPRARGNLGPLDAVLNAPLLLLTYLGKMLLPRNLLAHYVFDPVPSALHPGFLLALLGVAVLIALVVRLARKAPQPAFAAALACLPLLPVLYVPALGSNAFAERYAYLPTAGMAWLAAAAVVALARRWRPAAPRAAAIAALLVLAVPAVALTVRRNADWHDDRRIGESILRTEPRADIGYELLSTWYSSNDEPDRALAIVEQGLQTMPQNPMLRAEAVRLRLQQGRIELDAAIQEYRRLAAAHAWSDTVSFNLGQAYLEAGRLEEAQSEFRRTLELHPNAAPALVALAVIASRQRRDADAVGLCRQALAIDSAARLAWQQLGVGLLRLDDVRGATEALERAVELDPDDAEGLSRLGVAYARAGRLDEARRVWVRALEIDPESMGARRNLERLERRNEGGPG